MSQKSLRIKQEKDHVLLIVNGVCIADMPWQAAQDVASALAGAGKLAEEHACADKIISDQALLTRSGANFGLSQNPLILSEAKNMAAWDRDLRKSVKNNYQGVVGTPEVNHE